MKTVLVVDDDRDLRELVAETLTEAGYRARTATSGRDALQKLSLMGEGSPSLVLLDIMMPEMTGSELLVELGKTGRLPQLPVVVMSGHAEEAAGLGAQRLVRKPLSLARLLAIVRDVCGDA